MHSEFYDTVIIIDRSVLVSGSFNFAGAETERKSANLLLIKGNKALVDKFIRQVEEHKSHSVLYHF